MGSRHHRIHYLNTDLELEACEDLRPLVRALERGAMYRLHVDTKGTGRWWACLEIEKAARTANGHITAMLQVIDNLKAPARAIWDRCERRECHIGFECGDHPPYGRFHHHILHRTLRRMADVGLALRITLYPPNKEASPTLAMR